jgi:uroporphyrinogen-III synthase
VSALAGARIVNTRAVHQAGPLDGLLLARGALPVSFPCIEIAPPEESRPLAAALAALIAGGFDWLVFTSANAVFAVAQALGGIAFPTTVRLAAVGESTAMAVKTLLGVEAVVLPEEHSAAGLTPALPVGRGTRVLLPLSAIARPELADSLQSSGAIVTAVDAYQTVIGAGGADLAPLLARGEIAGISFFSPSAVDGFGRRLADLGCSSAAFESLPVACIGPTTAAQARADGFRRIATASQPTVPALVDALETALAPSRKGVLRCP